METAVKSTKFSSDNGAITMSSLSWRSPQAPLWLAQAAYRRDRKGVGNDFELKPGPEHDFEILIFGSMVRAELRIESLNFKPVRKQSDYKHESGSPLKRKNAEQ